MSKTNQLISFSTALLVAFLAAGAFGLSFDALCHLAAAFQNIGAAIGRPISSIGNYVSELSETEKRSKNGHGRDVVNGQFLSALSYPGET